MTRLQRLALSGTALASCMAVVLLLISLSSESEGPLAASLDRFGTAVGSIEHRIRQHFGNGVGRNAEVAWFNPYRQNADRLRRPDRVLVGAYDSALPNALDGVVELERALTTTFPLIQFYSAWGDKADEQFPLRLATAVWDMGSLPMITWEPWLTDFENAQHPHLPLRDARDRHGLTAVAKGDYDFYVDAWASAAAAFGKPLFLRFGHEMNDPYRYPWGPQNNNKEEYIWAWQHLRSRFERAGARNVIWVWSPHVGYPYWDTYYPGDDAVDWVATGALNFGAVGQQWSQWWSFREIFGSKYPRLASFGKPVMVAEFGSLAVGGDRSAWYRDALTNLPSEYPAVKALFFFHAKNDQTVTYQKLDWSLASDPDLAHTISAAMSPWLPTAPNASKD
ncbi:MAG TPA: hypothetical protein VF456_18495 [Vicinamibacterales bacterium]